MGSQSPSSFRSSRCPTRTTRSTSTPSATSSATSSTTRACPLTRRWSTRSTAATSRREPWAPRRKMADAEFAVCVATFYEDLAERLVNGAVEAFSEHGISPASVHTHEVPGAFELPLAAKWCAESGRFAGVACVGAVIRGETSHYEHVCSEAARGVQDVALATGVPCAFGVITAEDMKQALARAGGEKRNQGRDSAVAVMRMALLRDSLG